MKRFYSFFDHIGEFITSMAIVIILLVPFMWYRFYEFKTLFLKWLPINDPGEKAMAGQLISMVFICITVLFMVNVKRLFYGVNLILAGTSFTLNLFFWSLKPDHNWWFILFISVVIASMDYGLAHLFDTMWKERNQVKDLDQLAEEYDTKSLELDNVIAELDELEPKVGEYQALLDRSTCKKCGYVATSPSGLNAHKCKTVNNKL